MSSNTNHPVASNPSTVGAGNDDLELANWTPSGDGTSAASGPKLQRYVSALKRFKWLILSLTILGGIGGYVSTQFIEPEFAVNATIAMDLGGGLAGGRGPIQVKA